MFSSAGAFSGLFGSQNSVRSNLIEPRGYLKHAVDVADISKELKQDRKESFEEGPQNQEDQRKINNLAFRSQIKRAEVINQLGGIEKLSDSDSVGGFPGSQMGTNSTGLIPSTELKIFKKRKNGKKTSFPKKSTAKKGRQSFSGKKKNTKKASSQKNTKKSKNQKIIKNTRW